MFWAAVDERLSCDSGSPHPAAPRVLFLATPLQEMPFMLRAPVRLTALAILIAGLAVPSVALAHCQVPCGIYGDQLRFEQLLEDTATIAKAQAQLNELLAGGQPTAQSVNQMARWVMTKEEHAGHVQETLQAYFLAQRIKADSPRYVEQLKAAHAVITSAMKCKQSADGTTAETLKEAVFNLYRAYEGKEPDFESHN
jgi:nickel superoxide dismutase